jgi:hypothetical protein
MRAAPAFQASGAHFGIQYEYGVVLDVLDHQAELLFFLDLRKFSHSSGQHTRDDGQKSILRTSFMAAQR